MQCHLNLEPSTIPTNQAYHQTNFWGIADDNTWLSEFSSGRQDFPLLFDTAHDPKQAYDAVIDF